MISRESLATLAAVTNRTQQQKKNTKYYSILELELAQSSAAFHTKSKWKQSRNDGPSKKVKMLHKKLSN